MPATQRGRFQVDEQRVAVNVNNNANQSLTNGAQTAINFQVEIADTHGMHDNVTNNTRLTCVVPGLYLVGATVCFSVNATGQRLIDIIRFGSGTIYVASQLAPASAGFNTIINATGLVRLNAGDYLEVYGTQTSGGALNVLLYAASNETSFWAVRLGA